MIQSIMNFLKRFIVNALNGLVNIVKATPGFLMRHIGYVGILIAVVAGYFSFPLVIVLIVALIMTLLYVKARQNIDNEAVRADRPNPFVDGAYLFAVQLMVIFVAYCIGYFAVSPAGDSFVAFLKGGR